MIGSKAREQPVAAQLAVEPGPALVVGFDGHLTTAYAMRTAAELAVRLEASVHVVHAVTLSDYGIDPDTDDFERVRDEHLREYRQIVADVLGGTGVPWDYHEPVGDPARRLSEVAAAVGALLIVVAAEHGGLLHHLVGDHVIQHLLRHQDRPVLVVPQARAGAKASPPEEAR